MIRLIAKAIWSFLILILFQSCSDKIISPTFLQTQKITVLPGPEDMVLDTINIDPRILISCSGRREGDTLHEIVSFDLRTNSIFILPRINEPADLVFRPHGIDLIHNELYGTLLYVISHNDDLKQHSVLVYSVFENHLEFVDDLRSVLLNSPNDLEVLPNGSFYIGNDAGKRNSNFERIFALRRSNLVYFDGISDWKIVADKLSYTNGILKIDSSLFVAETRKHRINEFTISDQGVLLNKRHFAKIKGPDNLMEYRGGLIVAAHPKAIRFIRHAINKKNNSPSHIIWAEKNTGNLKRLFYNDGTDISASSTAFIYGSRLFISQVFEPYILVVNLDQADLTFFK